MLRSHTLVLGLALITMTGCVGPFRWFNKCCNRGGDCCTSVPAPCCTDSASIGQPEPIVIGGDESGLVPVPHEAHIVQPAPAPEPIAPRPTPQQPLAKPAPYQPNQ